MKTMKTRIRSRLPVLVAAGPYAAVIILLVLVPLLYIAVMSIMTRPSYGGVEFTVSFSGYRSLFDRAYLVALWNSVRISLVSTVLILAVSYPMALILARANRKTASRLIVLMMIPYFTNGMVRLYSYVTLFNANGILNTLLQRLGAAAPLELLYTENAVILGLLYVCIPYAVLPMYASLEKIDQSVLEASYDLGARRAHTFLRITLPLSMPGVYAAAVISFVPSLGSYFVSDILGGSKTLLVGNLIKNQFESTRNWPLGSALSILLVAGTLIHIRLYIRVGGQASAGGAP